MSSDHGSILKNPCRSCLFLILGPYVRVRVNQLRLGYRDQKSTAVTCTHKYFAETNSQNEVKITIILMVL